LNLDGKRHRLHLGLQGWENVMDVVVGNSLARVAGMNALLGMTAVHYETFVYRLASFLTIEVPGSAAKKYQGGSWTVERVQSEAFGEAYWWKLETQDVFCYSNSMNGVQELVDAEMLSMAVCLMATSDLCSGFFKQHQDAQARGEAEPRLKALSAWNELYHDMHHALRESFFARVSHDEKRSALLYRLID
jgi:hypothetical protein